MAHSSGRARDKRRKGVHMVMWQNSWQGLFASRRTPASLLDWNRSKNAPKGSSVPISAEHSALAANRPAVDQVVGVEWPRRGGPHAGWPRPHQPASRGGSGRIGTRIGGLGHEPTGVARGEHRVARVGPLRLRRSVATWRRDHGSAFSRDTRTSRTWPRLAPMLAR